MPTKLGKGDTLGRTFPYRIIRELGEGEGGMSTVYLASIGEVEEEEELPSRKLVALKVANVESEYHQFHRDTLDNEVEHLRRLDHPGIVRLHRIQGQTLPPNPIYSAQTNLEGKPWFSVMEYLAGGSLADLLRQHGALNLGLALRIGQRLAETLAYIHSQGHVHLDIKPENVVFRRPLTDTIEPVLIDFGIARGKGQMGLEGGTIKWSPPERIEFLEQAEDEEAAIARPHPAMDVYALGLLLYKMVTGRLPYRGSRKRITSAILEGNPTTPSEHNANLPPGLDKLILSMLARNPEERPTAKAVASRLEALQFAQPAATPVTPPATSSSSRVRTFALIAATAIAFTLIGLVLSRTGSIFGGENGPPGGEVGIEGEAADEDAVASVGDEGAVAAGSGDASLPANSVEDGAAGTGGGAEGSIVATSTRVPTRTPGPATETPAVTTTATLSTTVTATGSATQPSTPTAEATATTAQATTTSVATSTPLASPTATTGNTLTGDTVVVNFESCGSWSRGDEPWGTFQCSSAQVASGGQAGQLSYDFTPASASNDYLVFMQQRALPGEPLSMRMMVYGDGSGHFLNLWIRDANGQVWQMPLGTVSHTGWRQMAGPIDASNGWPWTHISGPNNQSVDYPISFAGIVLDGHPERAIRSGTIYVDDLMASPSSVGWPSFDGGISPAPTATLAPAATATPAPAATEPPDAATATAPPPAEATATPAGAPPTETPVPVPPTATPPPATPTREGYNTFRTEVEFVHESVLSQLGGRVVDRDGNPIPGVTVEIESPRSTTVTGAEGWYRFDVALTGGVPVNVTLRGPGISGYAPNVEIQQEMTTLLYWIESNVP